MGTCTSHDVEIDFRTNLKKLPLDIPISEKILNRRRGGVPMLSDLSSFIKESTEDFEKTSQPKEYIEQKIQELEHKVDLVSKIDCWDMNIFEISDLSEDHPICCVGMYLLKSHGLIEEFGLNTTCLSMFLYEVQRNYWSINLYHNATHAADVAQSMNILLTRCPFLSENVTKVDYFACILAALCHDLNHPGVNQKFLRNTDHIIVSTYQASPLENFHAARAHTLLKSSGLIKHLDDDVQKEIYTIINHLILATDMEQHRTYMEKFNVCVATGLNMKDKKTKILTLCIAIKCADISNGCRPWIVCKSWAENIMGEFFIQGDIEKEMELPISPLCNREQEKIPQSQVGFINYVLLPLFECWQNAVNCEVIGEAIAYLKSNRETWNTL
ncbi:High affinity cAMP-specific 3',5'-cyclic phosphodiesterase 7A isoform X2 [Oopsacas minuta]|uniref:High affinity cAMP-specific 3',5'-cyclic phosphodiesterase 7A isoform X2 n=1 Tax=Oopsacas minuta TaxID=111878 RepID=A0AAV7JX80_9METZ|nr:High affinity cAMP-specific 3',5'-cyclic phosphodiesterase 7A isoform X2 [Oopsacas minuta]